MKKIRFIILSFCFLFFILSGCAGLNISSEPGTTSAKVFEKKEITSVYYDFEDILIPEELSIVQEKTTIISTPDFVSGILVLQGSVEKSSLFDFFTNNMMKDNWTIEGSIKSPEAIILVFKKETRCAVIILQDTTFGRTIVQIGVAPLLNFDKRN